MCGVIGVLAPAGSDVFETVTRGLFQMQHRGQDACGIALSDGEKLRRHRGLGYVREVFRERPGPEFRGHLAVGHVRYPTQGGNRLDNAQPHVVVSPRGPEMALCSNGDLTNYWSIRRRLEAEGIVFAGTNDAELLLNYLHYHHALQGRPLIEAIRRMQDEVEGAYSACLLTRESMIAIRDPYGVRPLCFGQGAGAGWVVASETTALDINRVDLAAEVEPGEIVAFDEEGVQRLPHPDVVKARRGRATPAHCVFEYVYFSRPDAIAYGQRVYDVRKRIGEWLAQHDPVRGDVVIPVPDSSNAVALGYAHRANLPFEFGLVRNHYIGRTFISPDQPMRDDGVRMKFNPLRSVFKNRKVILVDDSIVRGTTSRKLVRMVRAAGASEVHLRIGSPITRFPCYYGIDTPNAEELIGNRLTREQICEHLTADSLLYMSVDGLREVAGNGERFCMACFDGAYPIEIREAKVAREKPSAKLPEDAMLG
jgi:amidophosphoribosyltransferase